MKIFYSIHFILVADEESLLSDAADIDPNRQAYDVGELISFASFDIPNETNPSNQTIDVSVFPRRKNISTYIL